MKKIDNFGADDSKVDVEDVNAFIYDINNFTEKTFQFINNYFFDNSLNDVWKF